MNREEIIAKLTLEDLQAHNPILLGSIKDSVDTTTIKAEAKKEGTSEENARLKSIEDLKNPSNSALIDGLKFDSSLNQGAVALKVLAAQKAANDKSGADFLADAEDTTEESGELANQPDSSEAKAEAKKAIISNMVKGGNSARPVNLSSLDKVNV